MTSWVLLLALAAQVSPPVLIENAEAEYPPAAAAEHRTAVVGLQLTVDAQGVVTKADVIEPAGFGFDEAAQQAALRLRFSPATVDGSAVAVQFHYRWQFQLAAPEPATLVVHTHAATAVTLRPADGTEVIAHTDDAGLARFENLPAGDATVRTDTASGHVTLEPGAVTELTLTTPDAGTRETVVRSRSQFQRLRASAEAVTVLDTSVAKGRAADLGELLARTQGITVRRGGGLGATATFSLNGLEGDQVRMFLDSVPLELAGYPFGVWNVPVNLVRGVEVYRGVVPVRFGTDALGGALNLVSDNRPVTNLAASYQVGSFGTHRVTLAGTLATKSGWSFHAEGFFDRALNDYFVDVDVADTSGQLKEERVKRFHDAYRAGGGSLEARLDHQRWAKTVSLRVFGSAYDKQLQNNPVMTVPYGEARYGEIVAGATARSEHQLLESLSLETLLSYAYRRINFVDQTQWVYDWYGHRISPQTIAGETDATPHDQSVWQHNVLGRVKLEWRPNDTHAVRVAVTPNSLRRTGNERLDTATGARDPLNASRSLVTNVTGLEYQLDVLPFSDDEKRLQNVIFAKHYFYGGSSGELLPNGGIKPISWSSSSFGAGDALRVHATDWLSFKASYEYATRLPRPDEVFGNGVLIRENLTLEPELSHNANLGPRVDVKAPWLGSLAVEANAFLRDSDKLIVLLGQTMFLQYQNVVHARALGAEGQLAWSSPGEWVNVQGSLTWQDVRNVSPTGTFARYDGDRIPNRPWLFGSWGASVRWKRVFADDVLEPYYEGRYVHSFFRTWESVGLGGSKQQISTQLTHAVGLSYAITLPFGRFSASLEGQNLGDARVYDVFGVQKPGRAFYFKLTAELR